MDKDHYALPKLAKKRAHQPDQAARRRVVNRQKNWLKSGGGVHRLSGKNI